MMGSLRELAQQALGSMERPLEQQLEQLERAVPPFHVQGSVPVVVEHSFRQKSAEAPTCSTVPLPMQRNAGTLPPDLDRNLDRLLRMPCPARVNPHSWAEVVRDAQRLRGEEWAPVALGLGWNELDLFGAVPDKFGDPDADGLAVKLNGRRVLAICESFATVENGQCGRAYLHRGSNDGAVLLWKLGKTNTLRGHRG